MTLCLSLWCTFLFTLLLCTQTANSEDSLLYPYTVDEDPELPLHTSITLHDIEESHSQETADQQPSNHHVNTRETDQTDSPLPEEGSGITTEPPCVFSDGDLYCASGLDSQFQHFWPLTLVGEVRYGLCFGNTATATRSCQNACIWGPVNCSVSSELLCLLQDLSSGHSTDIVIQDFQVITAEFIRKPELLSEMYLLSQILSQTLFDTREVSQHFQQAFLNTSSNLINHHYREQSVLAISESLRYKAGTLLLQTVDRFGLHGVRVMAGTSRVVMTQNILMELCNRSLNCGLSVGERNRTVSVQLNSGMAFNQVLILVYTNLTGLLPEGRTNQTSDLRLSSPVVTVSGICDDQSCDSPTNGRPLISLTFFHGALVENAITVTPGLDTVCVHWENPERATSSNPPLETGFWSHNNCTKNDELSNAILTVCECSKVGTFAIVLNEQQMEFPNNNLTWIYAFGASFSLLALAVTVMTFIAFRALWSMSSGVHINLCVISSLVILSFAVRGDLSNITLLCTVFAVLKHYFLTVQLMWVLMDGIVLLLLSSKSKFKNKVRYYILGFTLLAYGTPLLYLCVCLPLGFSLWSVELWGYGDPSGCFLRTDTNFYFAYIAPVAVAFTATVIVFSVVVVLKCSEKPKGPDNKRRPSVLFLFVHVILLLYLGLTWLSIPFTYNSYVVYLSTFLVSFQGIVIFILYVPCSKDARESVGHFLSQAWVQCKHVFVLRKFKKAREERPSSFVSVAASEYEVQSNPLAFEREQEVKWTRPPRTMDTKSAINPSDVSLWRIAHKASTHREFKLQPTIEELEEKATVVTFL